MNNANEYGFKKINEFIVRFKKEQLIEFNSRLEKLKELKKLESSGKDEKELIKKKLALKGSPFFNCLFFGSQTYQVFPEDKWIYNQIEVNIAILFMKIRYFFKFKDYQSASEVKPL